MEKFLVVCDGMDGHVGSATASKIAVDSILLFLNQQKSDDIFAGVIERSLVCEYVNSRRATKKAGTHWDGDNSLYGDVTHLLSNEPAPPLTQNRSLYVRSCSLSLLFSISLQLFFL
jgi:hypothetical protein